MATRADGIKPVILLTGGGTGGHITPILAVAHELKQLSSCKTVYVGERGGKFADLISDNAAIDDIHSIFSGKYRRYYGESWLRRLVDIPTLVLNIRDVFYVLAGIIQAYSLLGRIKPDVVFLKGGFVGVPVGLAAALRKIPIITHDSDSIPGLANRIISRWATLHATAMSPETYVYPKEKTRQVGVLVEHSYVHVDDELQAKYKKQLGIPRDQKVILVTGGSSGAAAINRAMKEIVLSVLEKQPALTIIHQVGKGKMADFKGITNNNLVLMEFLSPMHVYMGAADIVITRASANTLAEIGTQGKPAIVIPSPHLADGHQLRNADYLEEQGAAIVVREGDLPDGLKKAIDKLLSSQSERSIVSQKLQQLTIPNAAEKLAKLIFEQLPN